ncbi:hypothetical protein [Aquimarina sp. Aq78]|uniref:hypothetical protein n=1 Tax=Aquimarina sp. Aq78 TaxID=1191889 RepID=UPI00131BDBB4|nr:hypothetical protein [Aquimarina sp. Aq78]
MSIILPVNALKIGKHILSFLNMTSDFLLLIITSDSRRENYNLGTNVQASSGLNTVQE